MTSTWALSPSLSPMTSQIRFSPAVIRPFYLTASLCRVPSISGSHRKAGGEE
jgi:hypothetical protein